MRGESGDGERRLKVKGDVVFLLTPAARPRGSRRGPLPRFLDPLLVLVASSSSPRRSLRRGGDERRREGRRASKRDRSFWRLLAPPREAPRCCRVDSSSPSPSSSFLTSLQRESSSISKRSSVEEEAVWETMLPPSESPSRLKRFALRRKRWAKSTLTWRLHSQHLNEADVFIVRNTLHRAFNEWAAAASSAARFRELPADNGRPADINIAFERGRHTDAFPFDGPDGVVAHAFYPRDGKLHFDADEKWTLNRAEGVNLYQTALHEIGHIIGLEHSSDPRSAMFHKKKAFDARFMLAEDDLRAIRELFPRRPPLLVLPSPPTSTTTSKSTSTSTSTTRSPSTTTEQDSNEDY